MYQHTDTDKTATEPLTYHLTGNGGRSSITIFLPGGAPIVATDEHPNFAKLRDGASAGTLTAEEATSLADLSAEADIRFSRVTDRVAVAGGHVYFDGDEVHGALADQIARFIEADEDDWKPLVAFMEKIAQNPQEHSRAQLYDWLSKRDFTITPDGDFIAYKGVMKDGTDNLVSITAGPAIVNGRSVNGQVPNPLGGIIEIARSYVAFDPAQGCSRGLHVGSYEYAHWFARGALLKVKVNPRDVVSVPTDCNWEKMRVCRYKVIELIDAPDTVPVDWSLADDDYHRGEEDDFEATCDLCGEFDCDGECEDDRLDERHDDDLAVEVPEYTPPARTHDHEVGPEAEDHEVEEEPGQTPTATAFTTQADPADHGADEPRGHAV